MSTKKIATYRRPCETIARDAMQEIEAGYEVILQFDRNVDPNRVLKTINFCVDDKEVEIIIRHAEFREYVEEAAKGATLGTAVAVAGYILTALRAGNPVTLAAMLAAAGLGALAGLIFGAGVTQVGSVTIYKYREENRVRLAPAA